MIEIRRTKWTRLKYVSCTLAVVSVVVLGFIFWPRTGALSPWNAGRIIIFFMIQIRLLAFKISRIL